MSKLCYFDYKVENFLAVFLSLFDEKGFALIYIDWKYQSEYARHVYGMNLSIDWKYTSIWMFIMWIEWLYRLKIGKNVWLLGTVGTKAVLGLWLWCFHLTFRFQYLSVLMFPKALKNIWQMCRAAATATLFSFVWSGTMQTTACQVVLPREGN